jgi:dihydroorotate dehydrogenase
VGGVSSDEDVQHFFEAGAGAVLMGSSPMYMPDLAAEMKLRHPDW